MSAYGYKYEMEYVMSYIAMPGPAPGDRTGSRGFTAKHKRDRRNGRGAKD